MLCSTKHLIEFNQEPVVSNLDSSLCLLIQDITVFGGQFIMVQKELDLSNGIVASALS